MINKKILILLLVFLSVLFTSCKDSHTHEFLEGICSCGETDPNYNPHTHEYIDGKCSCGETDPNYNPHTHEYIEGICSCGEKDPNYNPPHEHVFIDGKCSCGETEDIEITYTITFKDYDETILKIVEVKKGESVILPADPVRDGYIFIRWSHDLENITSDLVVTAVYYEVKESYSITYVIDDNLWYYSTKEEMMLDFLNDFYDFVKPAESRVAFIYGGSTYDATWTNYIGGSVGYVNYLLYNNDIEANNENFFFNSSLYKTKWYKLSSYVKNEICKSNNRFGNPSVTYMHGALDFKRYITNNPEKYVNNYGGATIFYGLPKNDVVVNKTYKENSEDIYLPVPTGKEFLGWYLDDKYTDGPYTKIDKGSVGDKVFYAKTGREKYTICFDSACELNVDSIEVGLNGKVVLPKIELAGYQFLGWYLDYERMPEEFIYEYEVSVKLLAKWKKDGEVGYTNLTKDGKIITYRNSFVAVEIPDTYIAKEEELRAAWVSSITNSFTPSSNQDLMKKALIEVLDLLEYYNMNCMIFHIRTHNNAFYQTKLAPIDIKYGTYESFEEWDYLTWLIDECHKRGIEFHAWMNPYRIALSGLKLDSTTEDVSKDYIDYPLNPASNPDNILMTYVSTGRSLGAILNPAKMVVQDYLVDVCMEVVRNYNVDAIHFDDYFYQRLNSDDSKILEDADQVDYIDYINNNQTSFKANNLQDKQAWRRYNIDCLIEKIHIALTKYNNENNKNVEFGISPTGTYKSGDGTIDSGSNTTGAGHYNAPTFCDTYKWAKEGWIDYLMPQCYTSFDYKNYSFHDITTWWNKALENTDVDLYIGLALSKSCEEGYEYGWGTNPYELTNQLLYLNTLDNVKGVGLFSFTTLKDIHNDSNLIAYPALQKLKTEYWKDSVNLPK